MIHHKSNHPVEIKKISVHLWKLRDEIEMAVQLRMEECKASGASLYIQDIKDFYRLSTVEAADFQKNLKIPSNKEENSEPSDQSASDTEAQNSPLSVESEDLTPDFIKENPFKRPSLPQDKISYGFVFLADINMKEILIFTQNKFLQGQSVGIELLIPNSFTLTADVNYCHHYGMRSRIISEAKPDFRLQCKFNFSFKNERSYLRKFVSSIEPSLLKETKNLLDNVSQDDSLEA